MKRFELISILVILALSTNIFAQSTNLSDQDKDAILYLLEEEKLARDIYRSMAEKWDNPIFHKIIKAEEIHTGLIRELAVNNNLALPELFTMNEQGVFSNDRLQSLYDILVEQGHKSHIDALKIGAKVEEMDIQDLDNAMANTDNAQMLGLYSNLKAASENHLRAFVRNLTQQEIQYQPVILSTTDYKKIISAKNSKASCCEGKKGASTCCQGKKGAKKSKGKNCAKKPGKCCNAL